MEIFTNPIRVIPGNRLIISNFKDFLTNGTSLADGVKISGTTPDTRRIENMTPPWLLWKTEDEQLTLDGRWKLTPNHDLELHVKSSNYPELDGEKIIFRGRIENVEGNSFSFRVQQTDNILGIRSGV
ncbi:MAG TPA: hypothetical protein PKG81_02965, partial [Candidatus Omnitrophota bacterium]|nr:hypothetical protein [Candidatus Omnitrophota bacterium]